MEKMEKMSKQIEEYEILVKQLKVYNHGDLIMLNLEKPK